MTRQQQAIDPINHGVVHYNTAVTREELLGVLRGGFVHDWTKDKNHTTKPAFWRMFLVAPDFTADLVAGVSKIIADGSDNPGRTKEIVLTKYTNELFVAHQLMSQLVDARDLMHISIQQWEHYLNSGI